MIFSCASFQLQGDQEQQEDAFAFLTDRGGCQVVVCDGMGGIAGGDLAARVTVLSFLKSFRHRHELNDTPEWALKEALHAAICDLQSLQVSYSEREMATTVTALMVTPRGGAHIVIAGDSPVFLARNGKGERLFENWPRPGGDYGISGISASRALEPRFMFQHFGLQPGDRLLVATDGVLPMADEALELLTSSVDANAAANSIAAAACMRIAEPGPQPWDNITGVVVFCEEVAST